MTDMLVAAVAFAFGAATHIVWAGLCRMWAADRTDERARLDALARLQQPRQGRP